MSLTRTFGGTMVLWRKEYDEHVEIIPVNTPAFLPIVFSPPGVAVSIHVSVYLPTMGKESEFMEELAKLNACLSEMKKNYPDALIYLRGDFNTSRKNMDRTGLLEFFTTTNNLYEVPISHTTYHHFKGGGLSDSHLDRLLGTAKTEEILTIVCKLDNPLVNSHHDLLISAVNIPLIPPSNVPMNGDNITAPRVENKRSKILWSEGGIAEYRGTVARNLQHIQDLWLNSPTPASLQVALQSTNSIMSRAASMTNKSIPLGKPHSFRSAAVPREIKLSQNALLKRHRHLRSFAGPPDEKESLVSEYNKAKADHRKLERSHSAEDGSKRDSKLFSLLSSNSRQVFKQIKSANNSQAKVHTLHVKQKTYVGKHVPDGIYDSISQLKSVTDNSASSNQDFLFDFELILNICSSAQLPAIPYKKAIEILKRIKPAVNDAYSITGDHYTNAGPVGLTHFHLMLNSLIKDINSISLTEVNTVYAMVLFKGHGKDKTSDRSYRTISTCPLVAKGLDLYVRDINLTPLIITKSLANPNLSSLRSPDLEYYFLET